jgi:hypothetical protein
MESILRAVKLIKDIVKNKIQREKLCQLNSKVKQMRKKNLRIHSHLRLSADKKLRKKYFKHKNNIINDNVVYLDNGGERNPDRGGSPFLLRKKC